MEEEYLHGIGTMVNASNLVQDLNSGAVSISDIENHYTTSASIIYVYIYIYICSPTPVGLSSLAREVMFATSVNHALKMNWALRSR